MNVYHCPDCGTVISVLEDGEYDTRTIEMAGPCPVCLEEMTARHEDASLILDGLLFSVVFGFGVAIVWLVTKVGQLGAIP